MLYAQGDTVYIFKNDTILERVVSLVIVSTESYKLIFEEREFPEAEVHRTRAMALFTLNGNVCLNNWLIGQISSFITEYDITGLDFTNVDFTNQDGVPYVLTDKFVDGCNFTGATMPAGIVTKQNLKDSVASYHPVHTKWIDGTAIGT